MAQGPNPAHCLFLYDPRTNGAFNIFKCNLHTRLLAFYWEQLLDFTSRLTKPKTVTPCPLLEKSADPCCRPGVWEFTAPLFQLFCMFKNTLNVMLEKDDTQHSDNTSPGDIKMIDSGTTPSLPSNPALWDWEGLWLQVKPSCSIFRSSTSCKCQTKAK